MYQHICPDALQKGISQDALTSCQTIAREATVECQLRNPTPGKGEVTMHNSLLCTRALCTSYGHTVSLLHTSVPHWLPSPLFLSQLQLQLYFNFNVSAIDLNTTEPLSFLFQVIDGFSRTVSANHTEVVELNTVANYTVRIE